MRPSERGFTISLRPNRAICTDTTGWKSPLPLPTGGCGDDGDAADRRTAGAPRDAIADSSVAMHRRLIAPLAELGAEDPAATAHGVPTNSGNNTP